MPEAPLVSVVIPVFNGERYLLAALESVACQTFAPLEVIVVDDGSTDGSVAIAKQFPRFRLIVAPHLGVSAARNRGVDASSGRYLAFLDADDTWYPDKIAEQVALAEREPRHGLVTVLQDYRFEGPAPGWFRGPTDGSSEPGFMPSTWLIQRECWDTVGPFDPAMNHAEDVDWLARARDLGVEFGTVQKLLATRRIHEANASGVARESREGLLTALRGSLNRKHGAVR